MSILDWFKLPEEEIYKKKVFDKVSKEFDSILTTIYLTVDIRFSTVSKKRMVKLLADYIISKYGATTKDLTEIERLIDEHKFPLFLQRPIDAGFVSQFGNVKEVSESICNFFLTHFDDFSDPLKKSGIESKIQQTFGNLPGNVFSEGKKSLDELSILALYKQKKITLSDRFLLIENNDFRTFFMTSDRLYFGSIREMSFYIQDKKKYHVRIVPGAFFDKVTSEIKHYNNTRIRDFDNISNAFLKAYLVNNMTDTSIGDLNFTYFAKEANTDDRINCSFRFDKIYKKISIVGMTDIDLNTLDSDLITLGARMEGMVTRTAIRLGRFSYRVMIIRHSGSYILNIRKTEGSVYTEEELTTACATDISPYLIGNDKSIINLIPEMKHKHFDIDFGLGYAEKDIEMIFAKMQSSKKGTMWINGSTNSWKSTSLKNILKNYYDHNVGTSQENKNILLIENPTEGNDYNLKQIEINDADDSEYKQLLMAIKRADLDMCIIGELGNSDVFPTVNEISNSILVMSTFHVGNIASFLAMLKYYSDEGKLNYKDVFGNVQISLCQSPIPKEKSSRDKRNYYSEGELQDMLSAIMNRLGLDREDILPEQTEFKTLLGDVLSKAWRKGARPIKTYVNPVHELVYEIITGDIINIFLERESDSSSSFNKIYNYLGYSETMLYKTFSQFLSGEITIEYVAFDQYTFETKNKTLQYISDKLGN